MDANVIEFTTRHARPGKRRISRPTENNVIALASWIGKAIPRRTPNGVYFTTQVLETPGSVA